MKGRLLASLTAVALLGAATSAYARINDGAASTPDPRAVLAAAEFLRAGRAVETCMLLDVAAGPQTSYVPALVLYGQCHLDQGNISDAEVYFTRALKIEPQNGMLRKRVELVRAIREFVLAPEPAVRPSARRVAEKLPALVAEPRPVAMQPAPKRAPRLSRSVTVARGYDSNVNSGTFQTSVDALIGGVTVPLTLTPGSRAQGDAFTRLRSDFALMQPFSSNSAGQLVASVDAVVHDRLSEYDKLGFALSARYLRLGREWSVSFGPNLSYELSGSNLNKGTVGGTVFARHALSRQFELQGQVDLRHEFYPGNASGNSNAATTRLGFSYELGNDWKLGAWLENRLMDRSTPSRSFAGAGGRLFLRGQLSDDLALQASYSVMRDAYKARLAAFPQDRIDIEQAASIGLEWKLPTAEGLSLLTSYSFQSIDSTIDAYDAKRHVISTGLRLAF